MVTGTGVAPVAYSGYDVWRIAAAARGGWISAGYWPSVECPQSKIQLPSAQKRSPALAHTGRG